MNDFELPMLICMGILSITAYVFYLCGRMVGIKEFRDHLKIENSRLLGEITDLRERRVRRGDL